MKVIAILGSLFTASVPVFAQIETIPTFRVTSSDVVRGSITVFRVGGTNDSRVTVKFAFTDAAAKRLEEFYRAHSVGDEVCYRIGNFERIFSLDDRKHFGREGFWGLPEAEARSVRAGLEGPK